MSSLAVLYLPRLGQPLAALSTTVLGDPPALVTGATTLRIAVPLPDPPFSGSLIPRPITVARNNLAIAQVDTEFEDPLEVFQWRVVTSQDPDGTQHQSLERLGGRDATVGTTSGLDLLVDVPRLGNHEELAFEVRNEAGMSILGTLVFGSETRKTAPVNVPQSGDWLVFIEGYPPLMPAQLTVTRGGTGAAADKELTLDIPRLGDRPQLAYKIRQTGQPAIEDTVDFGPADTRQIITRTVTAAACDVTVEGFPPIVVAAA
jgi:hypothetical protein